MYNNRIYNINIDSILIELTNKLELNTHKVKKLKT